MSITIRVDGTGTDYVTISTVQDSDFQLQVSVNGGTPVTVDGTQLSSAVSRSLVTFD